MVAATEPCIDICYTGPIIGRSGFFKGGFCRIYVLDSKLTFADAQQSFSVFVVDVDGGGEISDGQLVVAHHLVGQSPFKVNSLVFGKLFLHLGKL